MRPGTAAKDRPAAWGRVLVWRGRMMLSSLHAAVVLGLISSTRPTGVDALRPNAPPGAVQPVSVNFLESIHGCSFLLKIPVVPTLHGPTLQVRARSTTAPAACDNARGARWQICGRARGRAGRSLEDDGLFTAAAATAAAARSKMMYLAGCLSTPDVAPSKTFVRPQEYRESLS